MESAVVFACCDEESLVPFGRRAATEDIAPLPPLATSLRHFLFHGFRPSLHSVLHHVRGVVLLIKGRLLVEIGLGLHLHLIQLLLLLRTHFVGALAVNWKLVRVLSSLWRSNLSHFRNCFE